MKNILTLKNVIQEWRLPNRTKKRGLNGINFNIPKGSLTGFVGVNGAGKTTTIKTVLDFIPRLSGDIFFFDNQVMSPLVRSKIGFLPERPYFYDFLTGKEFLLLHWTLHGKFKGKEFENRCDEVLKLVDLNRGKNTRLRQYSKGMLQRIGIAQSILHKPDFLIWDEPMSGLDPDGRFLVKQIMKTMHQQGTTIFFSSHLLQDMQELCDRLIIIDQGKILFNDNIHMLIQSGSDRKELAWLSKPAWEAKGKGELIKEIVTQDKLQTRIEEIKMLQGEIQWIERGSWNLEEAFRQLRNGDSNSKNSEAMDKVQN
jgi:ABC-2 type transport system ATP-binding protein